MSAALPLSNATCVMYAKARLRPEEKKEKYAYNDATGKRVTCLPVGNLSIGYGVNLEEGLYDAEIEFMFDYRVRIAASELAPYAWFKGLDQVRASVLVDLCYNEGLPHLLHFVHMLAALQAKDWQTAHDQLLDSDAARKLATRYQNLAQILLTGEP